MRGAMTWTRVSGHSTPRSLLESVDTPHRGPCWSQYTEVPAGISGHTTPRSLLVTVHRGPCWNQWTHHTEVPAGPRCRDVDQSEWTQYTEVPAGISGHTTSRSLLVTVHRGPCWNQWTHHIEAPAGARCHDVDLSEWTQYIEVPAGISGHTTPWSLLESVDTVHRGLCWNQWTHHTEVPAGPRCHEASPTTDWSRHGGVDSSSRHVP